jgi:hypothetical protein
MPSRQLKMRPAVTITQLYVILKVFVVRHVERPKDWPSVCDMAVGQNKA